MTPLIVLASVFLVGALLATDRIGTRFLRAEIDGFPVPMIIFAGIAFVGIIVAGLIWRPLRGKGVCLV